MPFGLHRKPYTSKRPRRELWVFRFGRKVKFKNEKIMVMFWSYQGWVGGRQIEVPPLVRDVPRSLWTLRWCVAPPPSTFHFFIYLELIYKIWLENCDVTTNIRTPMVVITIISAERYDPNPHQHLGSKIGIKILVEVSIQS